MIDIVDVVRERGPITVAAFMELALYHPEFGYYARAPRRSGRAGDFFTSVDAGPLFGRLLERQLSEMHGLLGGRTSGRAFDLVEAGAGNGRLSADILGAARAQSPHFYQSIRLHLVEASQAARHEHNATLGDSADRLVWSDAALPGMFEGALIANELVDALPVHQVVMRDDGLREVYVAARQGMPGPLRTAASRSAEPSPSGNSALALVEGPPSTPALAAYLASVEMGGDFGSLRDERVGKIGRGITGLFFELGCARGEIFELANSRAFFCLPFFQCNFCRAFDGIARHERHPRGRDGAGVFHGCRVRGNELDPFEWHANGFCCGAGGAHMWVEETKGRRINHIRSEEAVDTGADVLATACPFCMQMFEDGVPAVATDGAERMRVLDIAELLDAAVAPSPSGEVAISRGGAA